MTTKKFVYTYEGIDIRIRHLGIRCLYFRAERSSGTNMEEGPRVEATVLLAHDFRPQYPY